MGADAAAHDRACVGHVRGLPGSHGRGGEIPPVAPRVVGLGWVGSGSAAARRPWSD